MVRVHQTPAVHSPGVGLVHSIDITLAPVCGEQQGRFTKRCRLLPQCLVLIRCKFYAVSPTCSDDCPKAIATMLAVLVVCYRVIGRLYMGFYYKYFHEYCFIFTPPVGLILADDVTEGFPYICMSHLGHYRGITCVCWTKPLKPWSNCNIYAERKGICNW